MQIRTEESFFGLGVSCTGAGHRRVENLGNTCYANAVALLLASSSAANMICAMAGDEIHECDVSSFDVRLLKGRANRSLYFCIRPLRGAVCDCARAYGRWVSELVDGGHADPHGFFSAARIDAARQHDAQEFLVTLRLPGKMSTQGFPNSDRD